MRYNKRDRSENAPKKNRQSRNPTDSKKIDVADGKFPENPDSDDDFLLLSDSHVYKSAAIVIFVLI